MSSLASIQANGDLHISYDATKAGLNQFTQATAVKYAARGIRANAVLPGVMDRSPHSGPDRRALPGHRSDDESGPCRERRATHGTWPALRSSS
jgi:NAD(P)-dependent dehydrogenase (short-subunit alcohol dehydrogenase family)